MNPTTMGVKLDERTRDRLKILGEARRRSPHWLMREAIREYLERLEDQVVFILRVWHGLEKREGSP